jgi:hypothetical protein
VKNTIKFEFSVFLCPKRIQPHTCRGTVGIWGLDLYPWPVVPVLLTPGDSAYPWPALIEQQWCVNVFGDWMTDVTLGGWKSPIIFVVGSHKCQSSCETIRIQSIMHYHWCETKGSGRVAPDLWDLILGRLLRCHISASFRVPFHSLWSNPLSDLMIPLYYMIIQCMNFWDPSGEVELRAKAIFHYYPPYHYHATYSILTWNRQVIQSHPKCPSWPFWSMWVCDMGVGLGNNVGKDNSCGLQVQVPLGMGPGYHF